MCVCVKGGDVRKINIMFMGTPLKVMSYTAVARSRYTAGVKGISSCCSEDIFIA
jgi:hypothetical protein